MKGIFCKNRPTKPNTPLGNYYDETYVSTGKFGGSIIHLFGREQNPARFKIMEVSVW